MTDQLESEGTGVGVRPEQFGHDFTGPSETAPAERSANVGHVGDLQPYWRMLTTTGFGQRGRVSQEDIERIVFLIAHAKCDAYQRGYINALFDVSDAGSRVPLDTLLVSLEGDPAASIDADSSSAPAESERNRRDRVVELELERGLQLAAAQVFEDGVVNALMGAVENIVEIYGGAAVDSVRRFVANASAGPDEIREILRAVAHQDETLSARARCDLIGPFLWHRDVIVRDGAVTALTHVGSGEAISLLKRAMREEPVDELREDMGAAIDSIDKTTSV